MDGRPIFRAGSLLIAVGALSLLVLHACSSAKRPVSVVSADPAATAQAAGEPNAKSNTADPATTSPPATPAAATNEGFDPDYMPATKAGGAYFPSKKPAAAPMQQAANPPHANAAP